MRVAITGSTGLIGTALAASLRGDGHEVRRFVRRAASGPEEICWDPLAPDGAVDPSALRGVHAVVHLAGAPIAGRRWTPARKRVLIDSRCRSAASLVAAMREAATRFPGESPAILLSASAIGWYGQTGDREVNETAPRGSGFLAELAGRWEDAAWSATEAGFRVTMTRTGIVLAARGGMLQRLLPPFRLGVGIKIGSGTQYLSWIGYADEIRAIRFLLDHPEVGGPVNLTAPEPVTSDEFTAALGRALRRPVPLRIPAVALRAALGELAGELLASARVVPDKLLAAGFTFECPTVAEALAAELNRT